MQKADEVLLSEATTGSGEALAELLERLGPRVRAEIDGDISSRWQSLLSVDDVMQQTYLDAFLIIRQFRSRDPGSLRGWLAIRAKRNLTDAIRMLEADKRGGGHRRVEALASEDSMVALFDLIGASTTPSRFAARSEGCAALKEAVNRLPAIYRQVVTMYDLEGMNAQEVSGKISRSVGAVHMLRARAHDQLAELLGAPSKYLTDAP